MKQSFQKRRERLNLFQTLFKKPKVTPRLANANSVSACPVCLHSARDLDIQANYHSCPKCGHLYPVGAIERLTMLVDPESFVEYYPRLNSVKLAHFPGYLAKLQRSSASTDLQEAVVCGTALMGGTRVALAVMDARFMMGSMGQVVGEKITRIVELATRRKLPLIIFSASGGARMQEGIMSLMQMAKTSAALDRFAKKELLYVSVLTHPTTGGVSASFALLGDVVLAEPKALIGFAGRRVIEKTINQQLPSEFQTAEFVLEHGFIDRIVPRAELRETLIRLIRMHSWSRA